MEGVVLPVLNIRTRSSSFRRCPPFSISGSVGRELYSNSTRPFGPEMALIQMLSVDCMLPCMIAPLEVDQHGSLSSVFRVV